MHLLQWLGRWLAGHRALRWLGRTAMGRALIRLYRAIAPENLAGGAPPGGFDRNNANDRLRAANG